MDAAGLAMLPDSSGSAASTTTVAILPVRSALAKCPTPTAPLLCGRRKDYLRRCCLRSAPCVPPPPGAARHLPLRPLLGRAAERSGECERAGRRRGFYMETRHGAGEEEEEEEEKDHPAHPHAVAASTLAAVGPGLMSSAANHLARGPEAGGTRCADNGHGRAASQGVGEP